MIIGVVVHSNSLSPPRSRRNQPSDGVEQEDPPVKVDKANIAEYLDLKCCRHRNGSVGSPGGNPISSLLSGLKTQL